MATKTARELDGILESAGFDSVETVELPVLDTCEVAFAVEIPVEEIEPKWEAARRLLPATGRWPLISTMVMPQGKVFAERIRNDDLFSRYEFEMDPNAGDIAPRALIAKSRSADIEQFLSNLEARKAEYFDLQESFEYHVDYTINACGSAPDLSELDPQTMKSDIDLEQTLLRWEQKRACHVVPADYRQPLYIPDNAFLVFLPTACSWESLAYINWFGAYHGVENYIALGKSWNDRFGAELWAHYGTMLQCRVSSPPSDIETAWVLAREHDLVAQCTLALPGIPVRRYAHALIGYGEWFLHERP